MGDEYATDTIYDLSSVPTVKSDVSYIDAISSIVYKDNISKAYSGQPVNLKVTFEAKQADNISWSSIDSYQLSGTNA